MTWLDSRVDLKVDARMTGDLGQLAVIRRQLLDTRLAKVFLRSPNESSSLWSSGIRLSFRKLPQANKLKSSHGSTLGSMFFRIMLARKRKRTEAILNLSQGWRPFWIDMFQFTSTDASFGGANIFTDHLICVQDCVQETNHGSYGSNADHNRADRNRLPTLREQVRLA